MRKLSESDNKVIRELWDSGKFNQSELARKYNTTHQNIHRIVRYRGTSYHVDTLHSTGTPGPDKLSVDDYIKKFHESYHIIQSTNCWIWNNPQADGYGFINGMKAHRFSWVLYNGPIPEDKIICHKCDNRACVNPEHLYLGTHADNALDRKAIKHNTDDLKAIESLVKIAEATRNQGGITKLMIGEEFNISQMTLWRMRKSEYWPCYDGVHKFNWTTVND